MKAPIFFRFAGPFLPSRGFMPKPGVACQLYTVRALTHADFAGTIRALAAMGYGAVELAGYGNMTSAAEVRKVLDDHRMTVIGSHTNIAGLEGNLSRLIKDSE